MTAEEITRAEVEVFRAVTAHRGPYGWTTNAAVSCGVAAVWRRVSAKTVSAKTAKLARVGVLECARVDPAFRYRVSAVPDVGYLARLCEAAEAFGAPLPAVPAGPAVGSAP